MPFLSRNVYEHRLRALHDVMDERKLDAVAITAPDSFFFFTNYVLDVETWERPVLLVLPRDGDPFLYMNELSTNGIRFARERGSLWAEDITFWSEHPRGTDRLWLRAQWPEMAASGLRRHGLARARIGVDGVPGVLAQAQTLLPDLTLVPIPEAVHELRWVKTEEELALVRQACSLTDWAQERYRENVRPGRFVQELDYFISTQMAEEACRRHSGEQVELLVYSLRGPDAAAAHGTGSHTGRTYEEGDGIVNIVLASLNGVNVENERTWFCGQPNDRQVEAFTAASRANEAAIAQLVAGNPVCSVDAAAFQVFAEAGFGECVYHRTGHGMGVLGHEFPDDMAFNERPLLAGEVYSAEPGIYVWGLGGFRHDDTVIVGETEPEVVTRTPKDLKRQIIPV